MAYLVERKHLGLGGRELVGWPARPSDLSEFGRFDPPTLRGLDEEQSLLWRERTSRSDRAPSPSAPRPPPPPSAPKLDPQRWAPILRRAFVASPALEAGNAVKFLVDGAETFREMAAVIRGTRSNNHFIYILGWVFLDDFELVPGDPTSTMRRLLSDAARRGVQIRAMLWHHIDPRCLLENIASKSRIDQLPTGAAIVDNETLLKVRLPTTGLTVKTGSHHQKVLIVSCDQGLVGFCGGVDVNPDRISPVSSACGSGSLIGGKGTPLHDVHCRITGPSAFDLLDTFIKRWRHHPDSRRIDAAKGAPIGMGAGRPLALSGRSLPPSSVAGTCSVAIARTFLPAHRVSGVPRECDIRALLLASIAAARRFIYMEEQYLVSQEAARALNAAVPRLSHVTILISASEITDDLRCPWRIRQDFIRTLTAGLSPADRAKVRVFHLAVPGTRGPQRFGRHTYVHAKTWVFDDELAVIGSANCNKRGWESDSEVDAFIFDDTAPLPGAPTFAQALRMRLWAEHLNMPASSLADGVASARHWLTPPTGARIERYNPTAAKDPRLRPCLPGIVDPSAPCPARSGPPRDAMIAMRGKAFRLPPHQRRQQTMGPPPPELQGAAFGLERPYRRNRAASDAKRSQYQDCSGWISDRQSFAKAVADHYLRTKYPALAGQAERIECPTDKFCHVTYPKVSVMVSFVKLPGIVIARRYAHPTGPRCEYTFRCLASGALELTEQKCTSP